jgi:hypothetical protein
VHRSLDVRVAVGRRRRHEHGHRLGRAGGSSGRPVVDMIEVRLGTRRGRSIASVWAIMPPREAPTTCAAGMPSASRRPAASPAMSLSV